MNYKNINDYEQLYLINENDEDAKKLIFEKYKPIVISLASNYYKELKQYRVDMDDLIQEGYIGLSKAVACFKEESNACFYTFSIICINNQLAAFRRKHLTNKNYVLNNALPIEIDELSYLQRYKDTNPTVNPDDYLNSTLSNEFCINFKNDLSFKAGNVFELRCNGFKNREIASLLGVSVHCVDTCIKEIKNELIKYFNKDQVKS